MTYCFFFNLPAKYIHEKCSDLTKQIGRPILEGRLPKLEGRFLQCFRLFSTPLKRRTKLFSSNFAWSFETDIKEWNPRGLSVYDQRSSYLHKGEAPCKSTAYTKPQFAWLNVERDVEFNLFPRLRFFSSKKLKHIGFSEVEGCVSQYLNIMFAD